MTAIDRFVAAHEPGWIALRRDLHRHPELGFTEYRTISRLAARLSALGYTLRMGAEVMEPAAMIGRPPAPVIDAARRRALADGADPAIVARLGDGLTGLVAEMKRGDGPVVAMRFDVDALPLEEAFGHNHRPAAQGFASARPGAMHACGHDGHAAIGIGLAELAASEALDWRGTLRLIFQPAEEGGRGARPMAEAGIVDDADWFYALHLGCDLPSHEIACEAREMMFSAKWDIVFSGRAAHAAANPEAGRNAILCAAQAVMALHALPRHGRYPTHVNVGRIEGGTARNVIADHARIEIELRGSHEDALEHMTARARASLDGIAAAQDCGLAIAEMGLTIGAPSSPRAVALAAGVAGALPGIRTVLDGWPLGGGDDAAFFMRRVRERGGEAAYLIVGSDLAAGHHATNFDFAEADIGTGVRLMAGLLAAATRDAHPGKDPTE